MSGRAGVPSHSDGHLGLLIEEVYSRSTLGLLRPTRVREVRLSHVVSLIKMQRTGKIVHGSGGVNLIQIVQSFGASVSPMQADVFPKSQERCGHSDVRKRSIATETDPSRLDRSTRGDVPNEHHSSSHFFMADELTVARTSFGKAPKAPDFVQTDTLYVRWSVSSWFPSHVSTAALELSSSGQGS